LEHFHEHERPHLDRPLGAGTPEPAPAGEVHCHRGGVGQALWLQLGSWHAEVALNAEAAGLNVVMDQCVKIEHARLHGGLHLAGFDTGVISSRRQVLAEQYT
jgi:hypothetical protein